MACHDDLFMLNLSTAFSPTIHRENKSLTFNGSSCFDDQMAQKAY